VRIFFQGKDESIVVNDEITVTVIRIDGDEVTFAIDAPEWLEIGGNESSRSEAELDISNSLPIAASDTANIVKQAAVILPHLQHGPSRTNHDFQHSRSLTASRSS